MADGGALTLAALGGTGLGVLGYAGALGVGAIFLGTGVTKLRHPELLAGVVANYRLLPKVLVGPVAILLPFVEVFAGIGLTSGKAHLLAPLGIGLLLVFAAAMGINIARGRREIDCGCGRSEMRQPLSWFLVGRNLVLALLLLPSLGTQPPLPHGGIEFLIVLAAGLAVCLLYLLFNAIAGLAASPLAAQRR